MRVAVITALQLLLSLPSVPADVVVNEIFYNAPNDLNDVQWIELYNPGDKPADLSQWSLDGGKLFVFPAGTTLEADGYLVVALNPERFQELYGLPALGPLKEPLSKGGERIELLDSRRKRIDRARYKDESPWPVSPDGYSPSLERICPSAGGELPENWAASPLPTPTRKPSGTPGRQNACYSPALPPTVVSVSATPRDPRPQQPINVETEVKGGDSAPEKVTLLYRLVMDGVEGEETVVSMTMDAASGRFHATIPAQPARTLVRYRIRVEGGGTQRLYPDENDARPALSTYVHDEWQSAKVSLGFIVRLGDRPPSEDAGYNPRQDLRRGPPGGFRFGGGPRGRFRPEEADRRAFRPAEREMDRAEPGQSTRDRAAPPEDGETRLPRSEEVRSRNRPGEEDRGGFPPPGGRGGRRFGPGFFPGRFGPGGESEDRPPRGSSAFIYVDHESGETSLFDYVYIKNRPRRGGFIVHFHKDQPFNESTAINIVFEGNERFLLAELLAYDVYRRAGNAAPRADLLRLWMDGRMVGHHLLVERINRSFLRRNKLDTDGNLYKINWMARDIVGKHEKKTNDHDGHDDIVDIIEELRSTTGDEQWKVIEENFNIAQVATYFAVNTVLSHWDGFFNNYYTYHDTDGTGKWEMYPWDQDKTWGYYDGVGDGVFFDMPLTYGMEGAVPPGATESTRGRGRFGGFMRGRLPWWRDGGDFSRPLLAHPRFRRVFLERTHSILEEVYSEKVYFPVIDALAERMQEDARLAAELSGRDPEEGAQMLERDLESLRTHITKRREFLLAQKELSQAGVMPASLQPWPPPLTPAPSTPSNVDSGGSVTDLAQVLLSSKTAVKDGARWVVTEADAGLRGSTTSDQADSVAINGSPVELDSDKKAWEGSAKLSPGLNRLVLEVRDAKKSVLERGTVDVLYVPPEQQVQGTLPGDATWSTQAGAYLVKETLVVPEGTTLRIEPGVTVFLASSAGIKVHGKLLAEGSESQPIRFTHYGEGTTWKRILLVQAEESRLSHCTIEYADCEGAHQDYYASGSRSYHEAIVAVATPIVLEKCLFRKLPREGARAEGDAVAVISDDPDYPGEATAHVSGCRFTSIGQGVHTRYSYVLIEDCTFTGKRGDNDDVDLYGESEPPPVVQQNLFLNSGNDDAINPTKCSAIIIGNTISNSGDHGIVLRDTGSPVVINNVISRCNNGGIAVENSSKALLVNNTVYECGRGLRLFDLGREGPPYYLTPGGGSATVVNCIVRNCREPIALADSSNTELEDRGSHVTVLYSNIEGGQAGVSVSGEHSTVTWGEGNIDSDPLFVNPEQGDFHLRDDSPSIDVGTAEHEKVPTSDLDGNRRPHEGGIDMGAYEAGYRIPQLVASPASPSDPGDRAPPTAIRSRPGERREAVAQDAPPAPDFEPVVLVSAGSAWKYLDTGVYPGDTWTALDYEDKAWSEGKAPLGYGDGDEATRINDGPDGYPTYYFRRRFEVESPQGLKPLILRLVRDDGAVVYLNGREVWRDNVPEGAEKHDVFASQVTSAENEFRLQDLDQGALVTGSNILAVEVHQASSTSSDVSFDLELREKVPGRDVERPFPMDRQQGGRRGRGFGQDRTPFGRDGATRGQAGAIRGPTGGPRAPAGERLRLVETYDWDGNGILSDEERAKAREYIRQNRAGRGGRRPRFPLQRPGGSPGEGTEEQTVAERITSQEVKVYPDRGLYDPDILRTIFIQFDKEDWEEELSDFYHTGVEVPAAITVDGTTHPRVGVRFRGDGSYNRVAAGRKRSFNLSFDCENDQQRLHGYKTLNLLNAHEDPSFLREVLYTRICRRYLPAPKANFVKVVVNGESWGIYLNVQQVNKDLLAESFGTKKGVRWKVPSNPFGALGLRYIDDDPASYERHYTLKTSDDETRAWEGLIRLFRTLERTPDNELESALQSVLNVENALWFIALETVFQDADGYVSQGSDHSMYQDPAGRFHFLTHDDNETFAIVRVAPGVMFRRGGRGRGADPAAAGDYSLSPLAYESAEDRPLIRRLLSVPHLRARYLAYLRTIVDESLDWTKLGTIVKGYRVLLDPEVPKDARKLYPTSSYADSIEQDTYAERLRVPGLKTFVEERRKFLLSHPELQKPYPTIRSVKATWPSRDSEEAPSPGEAVKVTATVRGTEPPATLLLYYAPGAHQPFTSLAMSRDEASEGAEEGTGVYKAEIPRLPAATTVRYYVEARADATLGTTTFFPPRADFGALSYTVRTPTREGYPVRIEALMAANTSSAKDPQGECDDWIRLYNGSDREVDLSGMYLSDDLENPRKWAFPERTRIVPKGYLVVWADEDEKDTPGLHASFKLSKAGESIVLVDRDDRDNAILDRVEFGPQDENEEFASTAPTSSVSTNTP